MNEIENVISLRAVGKTFISGETPIHILEDIDFDIQSGQSIAVTGKSGSGKSTLLNIVGTLDRPTTGSVYFQGQDTSTLTDRELSQFRNTNIGFIFQSHLLLDDFNALENVCIPARIKGMHVQQARRRATELLVRVGMEDRLSHSPLKLSGGERQRIAICRALMNNPPIIIADEPTGSLDEESSQQVADILFELVEEEHKAMLLVTHDRQTAQRCTSMYLLQNRSLQRLK